MIFMTILRHQLTGLGELVLQVTVVVALPAFASPLKPPIALSRS